MTVAADIRGLASHCVPRKRPLRKVGRQSRDFKVFFPLDGLSRVMDFNVIFASACFGSIARVCLPAITVCFHNLAKKTESRHFLRSNPGL